MSDTIETKSFAQFQDEMIEAAKRIQGDNYPGDEYYRQICWRDYYDDGNTPEQAVIEDMGYWEPSEADPQ